MSRPVEMDVRDSIILKTARRLGLFKLSLKLTEKKLRIMCYHGFSFSDEHQFRPQLYMQAALFEKRMDWLAKEGYSIISLGDAYDLLSSGRLKKKSVVITIDDGFYSVLALAIPVLRRLKFTATIYMTTYYCHRENPVFRLVVQYMFWATRKDTLDLSGLIACSEKQVQLNAKTRSSIQDSLIEYGENKLTEVERSTLALNLGIRLGVDYKAIQDSRKFSLMNSAEVHDLAEEGFDIQLHTHRHRFPPEETIAAKEIDDNRRYLEKLTAAPLQHFCYPSGEWSKSQWDILKQKQVKTATTCELGLVSAKSHPLAWPRILDASDLSQETFESEVSGFKSILRASRHILNK